MKIRRYNSDFFTVPDGVWVKYKQHEEENQRLRDLLAEAHPWLRCDDAIQYTVGLIKRIDEALGEG